MKTIKQETVVKDRDEERRKIRKEKDERKYENTALTTHRNKMRKRDKIKSEVEKKEQQRRTDETRRKRKKEK